MDRIRVGDNQALTDAEFDLCCRICEIIAAVEDQMPAASAPRGVHWGELDQFPTIHRDRRRDHFAIAVLLPNGFRDFPTVAYEDARWTPQPDFYVRRYQRLSAALPAQWRLELPARFGEIGWKVNGFPVNRHVCVNQERIAGLYILGLLQYLESRRTARVLEIGGGAGEMGYALARALPASFSWYDCDLPRSLAFAATRLAVLLPRKRHAIYVGDLRLPAGIDERLVIRSPREAAALEGAMVSIPHFLLDEIKPHLEVQLAFNAWSLAEMSPDIARAYALSAKQMIGRSGVLAEQNGNLHDVGGTATKDLLSAVFTFRRDANEPLPASSALQSGRLEVWADDVLPPGIEWLAGDELKGLIAALDNGGDLLDVELPVAAWQGLAPLGVDMAWMVQFEAFARHLAER